MSTVAIQPNNPDIIPRAKLTAAQRRTLALSQLKIRADQVAWVPEITSELRLVFRTISRINSNLPADPYYYLKTCDHPDAILLLTKYYSLPPYLRRLVPIEGYCLAAGVPSSRVLELIAGACVRIARNASTIIASVTHPDVVKKTIEMALTDEGYEDRNTLHKAVGFLPTPKGSQINIQNNNNATAAPILPPPSLESTVRRLSDRSTKAFASQSNPPALTPGEDTLILDKPLDPVEVEIEEVDTEEDYDNGTE